MTKFHPSSDRILIRRNDADTRTEGGLYIPENAKERPIAGVVVAVGPGAVRDGVLVEPRVRIGDQVLFGKYSGTEIKVDGIEHLIVREDEILGVVE